MAFEKKTWTDRISEYITRRKLTNVSSGTEQIVDVERYEGEISQAGDAFSAANMNDLEDRIDEAITDLEGSFSSALTALKDTAIAQAVGANGSTFTSVITKLGTIINRGRVTKSLTNGESYTIPKGYHNGQGTVSVAAHTEQGYIYANGNHDLGASHNYRYIQVSVPIAESGYGIASGPCYNTSVSNVVPVQGRYLVIVNARAHGGQYTYPGIGITYSGGTFVSNTTVYALDNNKWVRNTWAIINADAGSTITCSTSGIIGDWAYGEYCIFRIV